MFLKIFSASMIAIALTTTVAEPAAKDKRRDTSAEWSHKAKWKPKPKKANTLPDWSKLSEAQRSQYRSEAANIARRSSAAAFSVSSYSKARFYAGYTSKAHARLSSSFVREDD